MQPFRVAAPKCGVIGESRYAKALRKAIVRASRDKTRQVVHASPARREWEGGCA